MPIPDNSPRSRMAGGAYWAMMKRIVLVAGCINAAWILMYAAIGAPFLAALGAVSVLAYAAAYALIGQRRNKAAALLIWAEVMLHATVASLLIGWGSGFHYFLLIFIPALVVGSSRRWAMPLIGLLLAIYLGLYAACQALGPLSPLQPWALQLAYGINVLLIFGMFYAMAAFYRATVIKAERRLLAAATTDPLTGLANRAAFHVRAQNELAQGRRRGEPVSLMLADVDFFKRINDEFGHGAGDLVLVRLAELMRNPCARWMCWRAGAAKSSWPCCPAPTRLKRPPWLKGCAKPWPRCTLTSVGAPCK